MSAGTSKSKKIIVGTVIALVLVALGLLTWLVGMPLIRFVADAERFRTWIDAHALTGRLVFGMDIPTVMLYRLFEGKVLWKEDAVLSRYLQRFRRQFAGKNYYVPQTVYELKAVLGYLGEGGGSHGGTG